jgi:hypothetical protein
MHNECTHDVTHEFMFDYSTHETSRSFDDVENIIIRNIDQGARQLHIVHETGEVIMLRARVRAFVALHVVTMTCNEYWR